MFGNTLFVRDLSVVRAVNVLVATKQHYGLKYFKALYISNNIEYRNNIGRLLVISLSAMELMNNICNLCFIIHDDILYNYCI